jgi:prenylcysteine oxidase/farnesylcysteine lyase
VLLFLPYFVLSSEQLQQPIGHDTVVGSSDSTVDNNDIKPIRERIAVIGAGSGGSSFSYYAQRYTSHAYDITIFESNGYIGGRSITVGKYSSSQPSNDEFDPTVLKSDVELGGSIFVKANKILCNAVEEFGLETDDRGISGKYTEVFSGSIGIWNGTEFVLRIDSGPWGGFKTFMRILWRYGVSGWRLSRELKSVISTFLEYFYNTSFPFKLQNVISQSGLIEYTGIYADELFKIRDLSDRLGHELIQPLTQVNYRSPLDEIHAMGMLISMAAEDATSVKGGNYKIFEKWIDYSNATLQLNTRVESIEKTSRGTWEVGYNDTVEEFDQVVIATPWTFANLTGLGLKVEPVEYRELHVTYVQTNVSHLVDHPRFGSNVPESILTTGKEVPFFSVNIVDYDEESGIVRYKIFSNDTIDKPFLAEYLFKDVTGIELWYAKQWYPYPVLDPVDQFDPSEPAIGVWYLNGMERFISTMETSALSGASVAGWLSQNCNTTRICVP